MKLLITREIPRAGINILKQYKDIEIDYRQGPPLSEKELLTAVKDADAIIPVIPDKINKKIINAAKKLRVIAAYSVGYDHIDVEHATSKNIFVGNTPGDLTESVAEHALALMLSAGRRIPEADRFCRAGNNKYWNPMNFVGPKIIIKKKKKKKNTKKKKKKKKKKKGCLPPSKKIVISYPFTATSHLKPKT